MIKTNPPASQPNLYDGPQFEEIKYAASGFRGDDLKSFIKRSSHHFADWLRNNPPQAGETYAHLHAMGSTELYGANRNADGYSHKMLQRDNPTFEKYARFYLDHCFIGSTTVVMADRTRRPISDVHSGDKVATAAGPKSVQEVYVSDYTGSVFTFKFTGIPERMTVTPNHPLYVLRRSTLFTKYGYCRLNQGTSGQGHSDWNRPVEAEYVEAGTVLPGDYVLIPRPEAGTQNIDPDLAALVGWVAADGYVSPEGSIRFTLKRTRKLDAVRGVFTRLGHTPVEYARKSDGQIALSVQNARLAARLREYVTGTYDCKTLTAAVLDWDADTIRRMLGAYIDGDGNFSKQNRGILRIRSASPPMRHALADCIRAVGGACSLQLDDRGGEFVSAVNGKIYVGRPSGCVTVSAAYFDQVCMYAETRPTGLLLSSKVMPLIWQNYQIVKVTDRVEKDYEGKVYNLNVPGPQHYLAAEVQVHNCNTDPAKSYGVVKKAWYNPTVQRSELIVALNGTKEAAERNGGLIAERTLNKLAADIDVAVSQSCFLPGTLVRLADGREVAIETVVRGTDVITHHGNIGAVNAVVVKPHDGEVVRLRAAGLPDDLVCTPDHKIWTRPTTKGKAPKCPVCGATFKSLGAHLRQKTDPQHRLAYKDYARYAEGWVVADHLATGDQVRTPFDTQVDEPGDAAYAELLGYYLAEGCSWEYDRFAKNQRDCYKGVDFCFARNEKTFHDRVSDLCRQLGYDKIRLHEQKSRPNATNVRVSSAALARQLLSDGGRYANGKRISRRIMRWSPAVQLKIVARFMDGDGTWNKTNEMLTGITVSRQLAYDLATICWRNGIAARINRHTSKNPTKQPWYAINVSQRDAQKIGSDKVPSDFVPTLTSPTVLGHLRHQVVGSVSTRSVPALQTYVENGFVYRRIQRVTREHYTGNVYDLSVPGDTSYVAYHIAVSNCKVPGDRCVSCGNWAKTRAEYCTPNMCKYGGCRDNLGKTFDDGFHLYVDNPHCTFFDISDVSSTRGADRTAFITGKIAGNNDRVIGGAELAEILGLVPPEHLLDRNTISAAGCLRKLASVGSQPAARSWDVCLAVRESNKTAHSHQAPVFQGGSAERYALLAELGAAGVILPPAQWLSATTGAPVEKCAAVFAKGVDAQRDLLSRDDLHDTLATQSFEISEYNRLSSEKYAWMSPSNKNHVHETIRAMVNEKKPDPAWGSDVPETVRKEAAAGYLAYQGRILAFHENSANFGLLLSECARHNRGTTL